MRPASGGTRPSARRRALGQHFLVDVRAVARIVAALDPRSGDPVLEIGAGRGALTERLLAAAGRVAAVEVDRRLAAALRARHAPESLALFEGDVLRLDLSEVARALGHPASTPLLVVGNLPYSLSKPIVQRLVRERARVARAVLMFQREVAARLTAAPGGASYGPFGILAGQFFEIEPLFDLAPAAFRPPPAVHSRVTRWIPRPSAPSAECERRLRSCLAACFAGRRKTVRNNLRAALGERQADALLDAAGVDGGLRAEDLGPPTFVRLAATWPAGAGR